MPFTFSHPAAVLPLKKFASRYFSMTALVIGSTVPDYEYFLRMDIRSTFSHTLSGTLWFDLPLTILLCWIFHLTIKKPLLSNLPVQISNKFSDVWHLDWKKTFFKNFFIIILSSLIGIFTHIFWDSFTHNYGYFVKIFPILKNSYKAMGIEFKIYELLQHISTILGGLIIFRYITKLPVSKDFFEQVPIKNKFTFWLLVFIFTGIFPLILHFSFSKTFNYKYYIIYGMVGFLIGFLISCIGYQLFSQKNKKGKL